MHPTLCCVHDIALLCFKGNNANNDGKNNKVTMQMTTKTTPATTLPIISTHHHHHHNKHGKRITVTWQRQTSTSEGSSRIQEACVLLQVAVLLAGLTHQLPQLCQGQLVILVGVRRLKQL